MFSCMMGESSGSSKQMTLAIEPQPGHASYLPPICFDPSGSSMERGSVHSIEEIIEKSKSHWSQVGEFNSNNDVAEVSNVELFKILQGHPIWGSFFQTFGKGEGSVGELVMGEKFAEGGQAEIYDVQIKWYDQELQEYILQNEFEWVLKVFKKGTFLQHLQSQWPQGMFQDYANKLNREELGLPQLVLRCHSEVQSATLLEDGRFAFVLVKETEDLRSVIDRRLLTSSNDMSPLSTKEALEAMYAIAFGMDQLHSHGIVHRDIKASNVLLSRTGACYIVDFECSVGVVGTRFWRAPEILEACKYRNVSTKAELFTKAVDIYSYGMTCYEILTGKLPFQGHSKNDYDLVLQGQRPKLPNYVDGWIQKLLNRCWQSNPDARPSFQEILKILLANSETCRKLDLDLQRQELEVGIRRDFDRNSKFTIMWRSLKLKMQKLKMLRLCRR